MPHRYSKKIYNCIKLTDKKYTERPSPPYHANECPSKIKTGNDGKKWLSVESILGIYKWIPYTKEYKEKLIKRREKEHEEYIKYKEKLIKKKENKNKPKRKRT